MSQHYASSEGGKRTIEPPPGVQHSKEKYPLPRRAPPPVRNHNVAEEDRDTRPNGPEEGHSQTAEVERSPTKHAFKLSRKADSLTQELLNIREASIVSNPGCLFVVFF